MQYTIKSGVLYNETQNALAKIICRMPRVDHAHVSIGVTEYVLTMHNSQNYSLVDTNDSEVLRIMQKRIVGGWIVESNCDFAPDIICGIFTFCRYIEQKNEFLIV